MSGRRGLPGGIGVQSHCVHQTAILSKVLRMNLASPGNVGFQPLPCSTNQRADNSRPSTGVLVTMSLYSVRLPRRFAAPILQRMVITPAKMTHSYTAGFMRAQPEPAAGVSPACGMRQGLDDRNNLSRRGSINAHHRNEPSQENLQNRGCTALV